ncbi:MAG: proline dehydrogenase family protein [Deltaproteobacteria bacterium]|nr:proline dehydrogenase family protein [Deltaproteobacteria bacterium]
MKSLLSFFARRYIAGVDKLEAIDVARRLNAQHISATIDNLGENVKNAADAASSVREYTGLLDAIKDSGVDSTVSLKLTHLGLDISTELASGNAGAIIRKASEYGNFVRLDMESSAYTERTLGILRSLRETYPNVGVAIQSCLLRSADDVKKLIESGTSVRLVKGAYKEPPEIAFKDKKDVDANFSFLMKELLMKGVRTAVATHDETLIEEAIKFTKAMNIPSESFEFQMLLGIKRTLQKRLAAEGFKVRVYVPYGPDWLPYILRRLGERKENLFFVLKNIFD